MAFIIEILGILLIIFGATIIFFMIYICLCSVVSEQLRLDHKRESNVAVLGGTKKLHSPLIRWTCGVCERETKS
jgi:hypothetical protein